MCIGPGWFVRKHLECVAHAVNVCLQIKYKEAGKKELSTCLYSVLPLTMDMQHAKEAGELLSEVTLDAFCLLLVVWLVGVS